MSKLSIFLREGQQKNVNIQHKKCNTSSKYRSMGEPIRLKDMSHLKKLGDYDDNWCKGCQKRNCTCVWSMVTTEITSDERPVTRWQPEIQQSEQLVRHKWTTNKALVHKFQRTYNKYKAKMALRQKDSVVWIMKPLKKLRMSETNMLEVKADQCEQSKCSTRNVKLSKATNKTVNGCMGDKIKTKKNSINERHRRLTESTNLQNEIKKKKVNENHLLHAKPKEKPGETSHYESKENCFGIGKALNGTIANIINVYEHRTVTDAPSPPDVHHRQKKTQCLKDATEIGHKVHLMERADAVKAMEAADTCLKLPMYPLMPEYDASTTNLCDGIDKCDNETQTSNCRLKAGLSRKSSAENSSFETVESGTSNLNRNHKSGAKKFYTHMRRFKILRKNNKKNKAALQNVSSMVEQNDRAVEELLDTYENSYASGVQLKSADKSVNSDCAFVTIAEDTTSQMSSAFTNCGELAYMVTKKPNFKAKSVCILPLSPQHQQRKEFKNFGSTFRGDLHARTSPGTTTQYHIQDVVKYETKSTTTQLNQETNANLVVHNTARISKKIPFRKSQRVENSTKSAKSGSRTKNSKHRRLTHLNNVTDKNKKRRKPQSIKSSPKLKTNSTTIAKEYRKKRGHSKRKTVKSKEAPIKQNLHDSLQSGSKDTPKQINEITNYDAHTNAVTSEPPPPRTQIKKLPATNDTKKSPKKPLSTRKEPALVGDKKIISERAASTFVTVETVVPNSECSLSFHTPVKIKCLKSFSLRY